MDLNKEIKLSDLFKSARSKKAPRPKRATQRKPKKQEVVGLKIGSSQLAAAHVVNNGGAKLVDVAREPLDPGIVVAGEVRDVTRLAEALDGFFTRNKLPRRNVRLGFGTNRVGVRVLDIQGVEDETQLANAVTFRAHETMAIPMDQAVLDFHVVGEPTEENGNAYRVVLAAAYREPIDQLVLACRAANLELAGIDVEAFALLRAVGSRHSGFDDGQPTAVVAVGLGHDRSILAISDGTVCDFTRVLDWGGAKLDAAITRATGVTTEEAAELKLTLSLEPDAEDNGDPMTARAREAVRSELSNLGRELIASLQYYQSEPDSLAIGDILVTGGTTRMPGLVDELARLVRARVAAADPLASVEVPDTLPVAERDDLPSLAVAIGLGVDG